VIAGIDEQCPVELAGFLQLVDQNADYTVQLSDHAEICRPRAAHAVWRDRCGDPLEARQLFEDGVPFVEVVRGDVR
jgi:hypothetical protein